MNLNSIELGLQYDNPAILKLYNTLLEFIDSDFLNSIMNNLYEYNSELVFKKLHMLFEKDHTETYLILGCNKKHTTIYLIKAIELYPTKDIIYITLKDLTYMKMEEFETEKAKRRHYLIKDIPVNSVFQLCNLCKNCTHCDLHCMYK